MRRSILPIAMWLAITSAVSQSGKSSGPQSTDGATASQLHQYKTSVAPRAGEKIAQACDYQASFHAGRRTVKAAWVTYDRGPDITSFYSDPMVLDFAMRNDLAMVLAIQCPAIRTGETGEMDMYPEHGLGRSLFSALTALGRESGHTELANAKLIILGFSGTGAYFGHFVAFAPDRVVSEKSIVLYRAVLKWSVHPTDREMYSCSVVDQFPRWIVHRQSRLDCCEFR